MASHRDYYVKVAVGCTTHTPQGNQHLCNPCHTALHMNMIHYMTHVLNIYVPHYTTATSVMDPPPGGKELGKLMSKVH